MKSLALLLILVPAPQEAKPTYPIGCWSCAWGTCLQGMTFHPDGRYDSPEFGTGRWSNDADGWVWFSEQSDTTHWALWVDPKTGNGSGWRHYQQTGEYAGEVKVKLIRRERLPPPREAE